MIEQGSDFNYLYCAIDIRNEMDQVLVWNYPGFRWCVVWHRTQNTKEKTRIKLYKSTAVLVLLIGFCVNKVVYKNNKNQTQNSEINFMKRTKGCTRQDHTWNGDVRKEL